MRAFAAVVCLVMGAGIAAIWAILLAARKVPEIPEGNRSIWFHVAAEMATVVLLLAGGIAQLVTEEGWAAVVAGAALGALLYTAINSPGYYADRKEWGPVASG